MGAMASQITSLTTVYSTVYSDAGQRKHQSSVSLAFVWGIHLGPVNSPHKWPVTRKMFPFHDIIMCSTWHQLCGFRCLFCGFTWLKLAYLKWESTHLQTCWGPGEGIVKKAQVYNCKKIKVHATQHASVSSNDEHSMIDYYSESMAIGRISLNIDEAL